MTFPLQASPAELAVLSNLFSHALGDADRPLKGAALAGRRLEEQFIAEGWPAGKRYGKEPEIARHFGVGHRIVRETARILEARGTARMCRGRGGGLEVTVPPAARLRDVVAGFSRLVGVTGADVRTAVAVMDRVSRDVAAGENRQAPQGRVDPGCNPAARLFVESLATIGATLDSGETPDAAAIGNRQVPQASGSTNPGNGGKGRHVREVRYDGVHRTRAGQIFHVLVTTVEPGQWTDGLVLGSEFDLCERFVADRAVVRQAIRILEVSELAESLPGRGRGLVARTPGPASLSRMICCHFAASRLAPEDIFPVFRSLSIELARLAADRACPADALALKHFHPRTGTHCGVPPAGPKDLMAIDERQFGLARNPLLEMFARSLKAYSSWLIPACLPDSAGELAEFIDMSAAVVDAIADGDPEAAAATQRAKFDRMTAACAARIEAAAC